MKSCKAGEVHDLRVAIRRFGRVLRIFKPGLPAQDVKQVRRALKKTMSLAGQVRDLDIAIGFLSESKLRETSALVIGFQSRRKDAERRLAGRLRRWSQRRIYSKWRRKLLHASPAKVSAEADTIPGATRKTLPQLVRRLDALGATAARTGHLEQLHQLRIAAKKLRYTLELLTPPRDSALGSQLKRLKKLQTILGDINDAQVVEKMVSKEPRARKLCAKLAGRRDRHIEEFRSYWRKEFAAAGSPAVPRKPPLRSESAPETARDTG